MSGYEIAAIILACGIALHLNLPCQRGLARLLRELRRWPRGAVMRAVAVVRKLRRDDGMVVLTPAN